MIKNRVYQNHTLTAGRTIELDQRAAHHLLRVLRMRPGGQIMLFNGDGNEYTAQLETESKRAVAHILTLSGVEKQMPLSISMIQSISRGDRMDWSIQKAVEMGVDRIVPVYSGRSIRALDAKREEKKMRHWQGIIISACEQSGRCRLPNLETPIALNDYLRQRSGETPGALLEPTATRPLVEVLTPCKQLELLIGPEGGWNDEEIESAMAAGFTAVSLGPRILRTETAGLAALAVIQSRLGDLV